MIKVLHRVASALALLLILSFFLSSLLSELFADQAMLALVKRLIPWGFIVLIPAMAIAGITGQLLGRSRRGPVITRKRRRMAFVAANGLVILVPSALFLAVKAQAGAFDMAFHVVQALELAAGAANITLLGLNLRDGLRLAVRWRRTSPMRS